MPPTDPTPSHADDIGLAPKIEIVQAEEIAALRQEVERVKKLNEGAVRAVVDNANRRKQAEADLRDLRQAARPFTVATCECSNGIEVVVTPEEMTALRKALGG